MFDFFRDTYYELSGIDSDEAKKERRLREEEKKKKIILLPSSIRKLIAVFAVIGILTNIVLVVTYFSGGLFGSMSNSLLQIIICIAILICMRFKTKKAEIVVLILSAIFILSRSIGLMMIS